MFLIDSEEEELYGKIRTRRTESKLQAHLKRRSKEKRFISRANPRPAEQFEDHLRNLGISPEDAEEVKKNALDSLKGRARTKSIGASKRQREREEIEEIEDEETARAVGEVDTPRPSTAQERMERIKRIRVSLSRSRARSLSKSQTRKLKKENLELSLEPQAGSGFADAKQKLHAIKLERLAHRKRNLMARAGEGDHTILTKMPQHLFSGKINVAKTHGWR